IFHEYMRKLGLEDSNYLISGKLAEALTKLGEKKIERFRRNGRYYCDKQGLLPKKKGEASGYDACLADVDAEANIFATLRAVQMAEGVFDLLLLHRYWRTTSRFCASLETQKEREDCVAVGEVKTKIIRGLSLIDGEPQRYALELENAVGGYCGA